MKMIDLHVVECASSEEVKTAIYITKAEMENIVMQD